MGMGHPPLRALGTPGSPSTSQDMVPSVCQALGGGGQRADGAVGDLGLARSGPVRWEPCTGTAVGRRAGGSSQARDPA